MKRLSAMSFSPEMRMNATMRFLLAGLIALSYSQAFARGGPGGAFGSMLGGMIVFAIIVGLIAGFVCSGLSPRTIGKLLGLSVASAIAVSVAIPFLGIFLAIPALVFVAIALSVWYLRQSGVFFPRKIVPQPDSATCPALSIGRGTALLRWLAASYVFWAIVSLANFDLLGFLAIPPASILFPSAITKFLPFLLPPLALALVIAVSITVLSTWNSTTRRHAAPFIFNTCLLITFFVSAEEYRQHLTSQALLGHNPTNLTLSSFTDSVINYRTYFRGSHGGFDEDGKTYHWSYAERNFYPVPQN